MSTRPKSVPILRTNAYQCQPDVILRFELAVEGFLIYQLRLFLAGRLLKGQSLNLALSAANVETLVAGRPGGDQSVEGIRQIAEEGGSISGGATERRRLRA